MLNARAVARGVEKREMFIVDKLNVCLFIVGELEWINDDQWRWLMDQPRSPSLITQAGTRFTQHRDS